MLWQRTENCDVLECDDGSVSMWWPSQQCPDHQGRLRTLHTASWLDKGSPCRPLIGQQLTPRSHLDTGHWWPGADSRQECNIVQRHLHFFISSIQWWHSPDIGNIANTGTVLSPRVLTPGPLAPIAHQAVALLASPGHSSLTPVFARSYHPQHQNVQSSIKSQR